MIIDLVTEQLLTLNNIQRQDLYFSLEKVSERKIDYSDLYFQSSIFESWTLENRIVKEGTYSFDQGVGVRAIKGLMTGFAYSDEISLNSLRKSVKSARDTVTDPGNKKIKVLTTVKNNSIYSCSNPLLNFTSEQKIEILHFIDKIARSIDNRVIEVCASLSGIYEQILIVTTDGNLAADIRPLIHLSINVLVEDNKGKREHGTSGGGGRLEYDFLLKKEENSEFNFIEHWTREAVRVALINLSAKEAPSGYFPVVLGSGWPGILLHEAVGHGLEGDFNRRRTSLFSGKIGKKVASKFCTIVDDGTIKNLRGSLNIDDEGVSSKYNILIENGILKNYMQDKLNARLMNTISTGNARRESYAHLPMPRMTNTYMLAGDWNPADIIKSVDYGLYASNFSGGQVDITSGKFVFSTSEAYLIKKGQIVYPVKNAMLIGSGMESMQKISMVGNDLVMDKGVGTCVKDGQSVPVGVGQPTIRIDNLTIGGTL